METTHFGDPTMERNVFDGTEKNKKRNIMERMRIRDGTFLKKKVTGGVGEKCPEIQRWKERKEHAELGREGEEKENEKRMGENNVKR